MSHRTTFLRVVRLVCLVPIVLLLSSVHLLALPTDFIDSCPGYAARNIRTQGAVLSADLYLRDQACNVYGTDVKKLALNVVYETETRIHVKIFDPADKRYEVPDTILPRPGVTKDVSVPNAAIQLKYTADPFSFSIHRTQSHEVLFSTVSHPLVFEPQYIRIKTNLPDDAHIYGLGEHTNPFHLSTQNTTLTLWSRDAYGIPSGTNLYGNHPVYFEHRETGTHGVFLLNSNGMDIKLTNDGGTALEYNIIGARLTQRKRQYAEIVGTPAEMPYWSFGFHQCRWGYKDFVDVAGVITNYSAAEIPLETMWTDIDYMDRRRDFTVDPAYFPLNKVQEIVEYLHNHNQRYVLITDPAIAYLPHEDYGPYHRGVADDIWLKDADGNASLALVWPGVAVYPDWFHPNAQNYWNGEFERFYDPKTGVDVDGIWIDMNEPSNFCSLPCTDPFQQAKEQNLPPPRGYPPPDPNTPIFNNRAQKRAMDWLNPSYEINNAAPGGDLSSRTAFTNLVHANGLVEFNTHNLFGAMMSVATRNALLQRRPGERPLVITRSTFAGAGAHVGKWFGDNLSIWEHYRISIAEMLAFASIYQMPMVGSDICGFGGNTTETLCARWALLGAFYPFMRNHYSDSSISHEFYRWPTTIKAAQNALDIRYRLLDYLSTAFHKAHVDGTPVVHPLWFKYPKDTATYTIDTQFFFGPSLLVSPVLDENSTTAVYYLPKDAFYDFKTLDLVRGDGTTVTVPNVSLSEIPLHIQGGTVLPLRVQSAMTTTEVRKKDFEFVVAPNADGEATGALYVDDGLSIEPEVTTEVRMVFANGKLSVEGRFGYEVGVDVAQVRFAGVISPPKGVRVNGKEMEGTSIGYDVNAKVLTVRLGIPFKAALVVEYC